MVVESGEPISKRHGEAAARGERRDGMPRSAMEPNHFPDSVHVELSGMVAHWYWECDAELKLTWLSPGFAEHTGIDAERIIGRSRFDVVKVVTESGFDTAAHHGAVAAREAFCDRLFEMQGGGGQRLWVSVSGVPKHDEKGNFRGYRGFGRALTRLLSFADELKAARRDLSLREIRESTLKEGLSDNQHFERLWSALEATNEAFACYDSDDRLVVYNKALVEMYAGLEDVIRPGVSFAALIHSGLERDLWDTGDIEKREWAEQILKIRAARGGTESVIAFRDGRFVLHREQRAEDGGTVSICTDVTAIKRHEKALEAARQEAETARMRLQSAIEALDDGFVLWDADGRLVACNGAFRGQFADICDFTPGRSHRELLSEFAHSGLVEDAKGREAEWVEERCAARDAEVGESFVFETHDGRWIRRRDQLTAAGDRVGIRADISERVRREADLAKAKEEAELALSDLRRTVDSMRIGVVVVEADMTASIVNKACIDLWDYPVDEPVEGRSIIDLFEADRANGMYDFSDAEWQVYLSQRLEEIRAGACEPREISLVNGRTLIFTPTPLSRGRRMLTYYDVTEMKSREEELANALERSKLAQAVIDSLASPIFVKDADLRFVLANQAFAEILGAEPGEMIGKKAIDFTSAEEAASFEANEREVLETGQDYEVAEDFELSGAAGTRMVRKNRVSTASGNHYLACTIFDVSDLKRRERDAEEARRQLANVLDTLPAGVVIYDRDDRFVLANRKIHDALPKLVPAMKPGVPLREALTLGHEAGYFRESGDQALDSLYDTHPEAWMEGYLGRYRAKSNVFERRNPDGRWFKVFDTRREDGTFIGVRVDITELKEREHQLSESMRENEVFRNLIDNVPVAIYAKKPDLKLSYVNKGWSDLVGIKPEDALGRTDVEIFGAQGQAFQESDLAVMRSGSSLEIEETRQDAAGNTRYQIARKDALVASDGSLYLIGSTTDVTELKRREHELRIAQEKAVLADRAKSEFLANMSHEIRTPMNGVLGMAELLAKTELTAKQKTFSEIILKSGSALLTIINDILDFSKIDAGQMVLDASPFRLAEAIEDVATLMSSRAKEKDLELIVHVAPALPPRLVGDVGRLRQIVTNLVGNAVKFTESGHVLVDVTGSEAHGDVDLHVRVQDTGIGIPADKMDLVFDKFSQVDASSTRRHEGTGLGLAITSRLVDLMGGEIGVESREGEGSTFWFSITLPRAEDDAKQAVLPADVTGARVLIIDDNAINRLILAEQMAHWGFDSCAAANGQEGLKVLRAAQGLGIEVDCVVLDYQMPGMSGVDVARAVRADPALAETPLVLLTSVDYSTSVLGSRDLAFEAQLIKPARSQLLLHSVVEAIQRRRALEGLASSVFAPASDTDVQVPAAQASAPLEPAEEVRSSAGRCDDNGHGIDILVAEDNEVNQLVFSQILGETRLTFEIVNNGREAVENFARLNPRIILMDVSMPEMNGLEATAAIRGTEAGGSRIPIIGVTAHALKGDRERCLEAGMDDYLSKPISPKALLEKIDRWSEDRRLAGAAAR